MANAMRNPMASSINDPDLLLRLNVNTALLLAARPASRTRIIRVGWQTRARLASDARIALFVKRQERDAVLLRVVPDIARGPVGKRADLQQLFAAGQSEMVESLQLCAALGLFPA